MTKKRVPSAQAEQEAEKKGLSGKTRRAYIGGAINRAKQEKKTGHAAASKQPAKPRKAYEKPALHAAPALRGSEKQVAWAKTLRASYVKVHGKTHPESTAKTVQQHPEASYWINNRYGLGTTNKEQREIQSHWKKS